MNKAEVKVGWVYEKKLGDKVEIIYDARQIQLPKVTKKINQYCMVGIDEDAVILCYTPDGQLIEGKGYVGDLVLSTGKPAKEG